MGTPVFNIFSHAADWLARTPIQYRALAGAAAGVTVSMMGDSDEDFGSKIKRGLFLGTTAGLFAPTAMEGLGRVAQAGTNLGQKALAGFGRRAGKTATELRAAYKAEGFSGLGKWGPWSHVAKSGTLAVAGAAAGAAIAGPDHRGLGAVIGGGLGFSFPAFRGIYSAGSQVGNVPGGTIMGLTALAAVPVAAGIFSEAGSSPQARGAAVYGDGVIDYTPLEGGMRDRMTAMNASGDIVFGLHGRRSG